MDLAAPRNSLNTTMPTMVVTNGYACHITVTLAGRMDEVEVRH